MNKLKFLTGIALFLALTSCNKNQNKEEETVSTDIVNVPSSASGQASTENQPVITFDEESHDFGIITQGEKVSHTFKFENTGKSDLVITTAQGSCGCTVPNYPKTPIAPGEEGKIDVVFASEGKAGKVSKTITVVTNANPNTKVLTISANIEVPEEK